MREVNRADGRNGRMSDFGTSREPVRSVKAALSTREPADRLTDLGRTMVYAGFCLLYTAGVAVLNAAGMGILAAMLIWPTLVLSGGSVRNAAGMVELPLAVAFSAVLFSPIVLARPMSGREILRLLLKIAIVQFLVGLLPVLFYTVVFFVAIVQPYHGSGGWD